MEALIFTRLSCVLGAAPTALRPFPQACKPVPPSSHRFRGPARTGHGRPGSPGLYPLRAPKATAPCHRVSTPPCRICGRRSRPPHKPGSRWKFPPVQLEKKPNQTHIASWPYRILPLKNRCSFFRCLSRFREVHVRHDTPPAAERADSGPRHGRKARRPGFPGPACP